MLCMVKMPLKGEVGGRALNSHGDYIVDHGKLGAQWLSGSVLDSRPKGRGLEPHRHHCVVSLSKTHKY